VVRLLNDAGFGIEADENVYVPRTASPALEAKIMKPQNIPQLIELGSHDIGFTGHDWVVESKARVHQVLDLGFDPVRIVAAAPRRNSQARLRRRKIVVASEYESIARRYLHSRGYRYISLGDAWKRERIGEMGLLLRAVLDARGRVMLEMNVPASKLESIVKRLPCMRSPTVSPLYGDQGYAVKVAVRRENAAGLIPVLKKMGATDILESTFEKVVP
jgi:ATP phosphoribosyltransferase